MIIVETCPMCGHDLTNVVLTSYPPIPAKKCFHCGYSWRGKLEEIVRVPFNPESPTQKVPPSINNFTNPQCATCPTNVSNGGSGICHCTVGSMQVKY